jgi:hypothetical protein
MGAELSGGIVDGRRNNSSNFGVKIHSVADRSILHEEAFRRMMTIESKRAERSRKPVLLTLLEIEDQMPSEKTRKALSKILSALAATTRETDVTGWYQNNSVVGVMFTEIAIEDRGSILITIKARVSDALRRHLTPQQFSEVGLSFHIFPEERVIEPIMAGSSASPLYSNLAAGEDARRLG